MSAAASATDDCLTRSAPAAESSSETLRWQQVMKDAVRDVGQLCRALALPPEWEPAGRRAAESFPLFVPRGYLARIRPGDPCDPLLRQVLPVGEELATAGGFVADPVDDAGSRRSAGLLHKYHGRVLMVTTGACAVHCRYCFRRHYPYAESPRSLAAWQPALAEIESDGSIDEVILSGGDPLTMVDPLLSQLAHRLAEIPHLRRLRVHTRLPIVVPERVTDELLGWLRGTRLSPIMVVHANHPAEIDSAVAESLSRLVDAGIPVLNQAVLLRGVNDSVEALQALCQRLVDLRVVPYYLHQLDRVAGAAHFEVSVAQGRALMAALRRHLPGYAVPRYVMERPGAASKEPLD